MARQPSSHDHVAGSVLHRTAWLTSSRVWQQTLLPNIGQSTSKGQHHPKVTQEPLQPCPWRKCQRGHTSLSQRQEPQPLVVHEEPVDCEHAGIDLIITLNVYQ
jgi:hypothetical protein